MSFFNDPEEGREDRSHTPPSSDFISSLNEKQKAAVLKTDGPVLILAGAGTGKTRVLTTRLSHILSQGKAYPSQILAVTFTNKAASEMKERVSSLLGNQSVDGWWLGTFHSLASRMLRRHAELVGLEHNFTILDPDDQVRLLKQILEAFPIDTKETPPRFLLSIIERWKDRGLTPEKIPSHEDPAHLGSGLMTKIYKAYQKRLLELNACDFGDLMLHMITIFQNPEYKEILNQYHQKFRYILVDEYQDTNVAQYLWLRLLAMGSNNICCVGDDDQSIYGWRGAEVGNILKFEQDFPGAEVIRLEQNYRSTGHILKAASAVIANNTSRHGKTLWTEDDLGELVHIKSLWDGEQEARWISEEIEALTQIRRISPNEIAVLVRASSQMREFEEQFINKSIPYRVIGGPRFYERLEIRDALAYFRVLLSPSDDLALERIIGKPKRGVGPKALSDLYETSRRLGKPLAPTIDQLVQTDYFKPKLKASLTEFSTNFIRWREKLNELPHTELAWMILEESGYIQMWKDDKSIESTGRIENLKELVNAMAEFESLPVFIEHVSLVMDKQGDDDQEMVSLMTLHAAKGLEFDYVFLPGWEEGIFPNQRSIDESGLSAIEEERRLAYVGITRAKKKANISFASNRRLYGSRVDSLPSRFVSELPEENIDHGSMMHVYSQQNRFGNDYNSYTGSKNPYDRPTKRMHPAIERRAATQIKNTKTPEFYAGKRVKHEKFGEGTILSVERNKLDIHFQKVGRKKILSDFVTALDD